MIHRLPFAAFAALLLVPLGACRPAPSASHGPTHADAAQEISPPRCTLYAGSQRDSNLRGMAASAGVRCCEADFGLDPALVQQSCGFDRYLGESEELACVHRFADARGVEHELRVTPMHAASLDVLASQHRSGGAEAPSPALESALAGTERSARGLASTSERHWVGFGSNARFRRLSWAESSCAAERMQPVIAAMAAAALDPEAELEPLPRLEFDPASVVAEAESLLGQALERGPSEPSPLPLGAEALGQALLHRAATEALDPFVALFSADARWGLPDRRELSARPVSQDPESAMHALRVAAARLPADARLHCPEPDRRNVPALVRGEARMWCLWTDPSQLDLIVLGLRDASVDYFGVFPHAPLAPVAAPAEPPPPPAVGIPAIICGDPHALDYPGLCPDQSFVEDDEDEDEGEGDIHEDSSSLEAELERIDAEPEPQPDKDGPSNSGSERVRVVPSD